MGRPATSGARASPSRRNEPLPNEWQHSCSAELSALDRDLTAEIPAVDPDHLIVYEGSRWATNWSICTEVGHGRVVHEESVR